MEESTLTSLSLTHVRYDPSDPYSYISAWLALAPQALCIIYVTLIWATREVEVLLMFAGQMACEVLNFCLKRLIKEERPQQTHGKGYGMPSSHAQFISFFSISVTFFLLIRHKPQHHASIKSQPQPQSQVHLYPTYPPTTYPQRLLISLLALTLASLVAGSRIYLNYHTPLQVLVGVCAGATSAVIWFSVCSFVRFTGWLEWGLETRMARMVRIRDLIVTEDLQDAGWGRWEARRGIKAGKDGERKRK